MTKSKAQQLVDSTAFKAFVKRRWLYSLIMAALMLAAYFTFIIIIAFNKAIFAIKIAPSLTVGIVAGLGIIIFAWLMTGIYVTWANKYYDADVALLKSKL